MNDMELIMDSLEGKTIEAVYHGREGGIRIICSDDTTVDINCINNEITMREVSI